MSAYIWSPAVPAEACVEATERAAAQLTGMYRGHCLRAGLSREAARELQIRVDEDGHFDFHVPERHRPEYDALEFGTLKSAPVAFERQFSARHAHTAARLVEHHIHAVSVGNIR